jgi:DNA-binding NarL/FixJ family response regulator
MKILVADPHPVVQTALHLTLSRIPGVILLTAAGSLAQLLSQCEQICPDLILLDLDLIHPSQHPRSLDDLLELLHRLCPGAKIATMSTRLEVKQEALAAGVSGFISKTDPPDDVLSNILRLLENSS